MAKPLDKTKTYLILNYNPSPVGVTVSKNETILIPGGYDDAPAQYPLGLNEIRYINNSSKVFKIGMLYFEPEYEAQLYEELRIANWEDILRDKEIEEIVLNPTAESLERILSIRDQMYFERIYGVYMGLRNAGAPISGKVDSIMQIRRKELARGKVTTELSVRANDVARADADAEKIKTLEDELAKLKGMLAAAMQQFGTAAPAETPTPAEAPKQRRGTKKQEE